ncbi:MAG: hypothetical protein LBC19_07975 [Tannerella sp.]|jgi:DNA-binding CsgD family transcriptional regulator|nr:hypothetical protein [Tannerella sp.]
MKRRMPVLIILLLSSLLSYAQVDAFADDVRARYRCCLYATGAGLILTVYIWNNRRSAGKQKADMERKEKEFQEQQSNKEQEIIALQNEKLEQELQFKSREMANLMIGFARKNEILMNIKQELHKIISEINDDSSIKIKRMIIALNKRIDSNIAPDSVLKRFEEQFTAVHNNFIKKVREKHPDLSANELKMCACIKMGLSSKETAPLMNLSVRGVETVRYRLRKKINPERYEGLSTYLNSLDREDTRAVITEV